MGFFSHWFRADSFGKSSEPDDAAQAAQIVNLYRRALGRDPSGNERMARREAAAALVLSGETGKAREAWLAIGRAYPADLAQALEQVGICHHLEADYQAALENYEAAHRLAPDFRYLARNMAAARLGLNSLG